MAERHDGPADEYRIALAEPSIRDYAANQWREVDARSVDAVDERSRFLREQELLHHVVHEQRAHPVERELLPHVGEKEDGGAARLAEPVGGHRSPGVRGLQA